MNGYFKEITKSKYLVLVPTNESKEKAGIQKEKDGKLTCSNIVIFCYKEFEKFAL